MKPKRQHEVAAQWQKKQLSAVQEVTGRRARAGFLAQAEKPPGLGRQPLSGPAGDHALAWTVGDQIDVALEGINRQLSESELLEYNMLESDHHDEMHNGCAFHHILLHDDRPLSLLT